jgi:hypothetical protein
MTTEGSPEIAPQETVVSETPIETPVVTPEPDDSLARLGEAVIAKAKEIAAQEIAQESKKLESKFKSIADKNTARYQKERDFYKKSGEEKEKAIMGMVGRTLDEEHQGKVLQTFQQIDQNVAQQVYQPSTAEVAARNQAQELEQELTRRRILYDDPRIVRDFNDPDTFIRTAFALLNELEKPKEVPQPKEETVKVSEVKPVEKPIVRAPAPSPAGGGSATNDESFLKAFAEGDLTSPADMKRAKQIIDKLNRGG